MSSKSPNEVRLEQKAARKQAELVRCFKFNQGYEDALQTRETNPAAFAAMSGDYRSKVLGYYLPGREAAEAAGIDVTGDSR